MFNNPTPAPTNKDYLHFLKTIKARIQSARISAAHSVNRELISLYWEIGKGIVAKQKTLGWGKSVVEQLSKDIQKEYDGISGFSADNLWRMRQLYEEYTRPEILEQAVPELANILENQQDILKLPFLRQFVAELKIPKNNAFLEQAVPETT